MTQETPKEPRLCPFITTPSKIGVFDKTPQSLFTHTCLGRQCAVWVEVLKPTDDPREFYVFRGCGLIVDRPYHIEKKGEKEKAPAPQN